MLFTVLSNMMSWVCNQWDSWIFHGKYALHSSSLYKVRLYGTLLKGKLLTGEASFLRQIKSSLNNQWEWMKAIQKMKLSKLLRHQAKTSQMNQVLFTDFQESSKLESRESTVVTDFSYTSTNNRPCVKWEIIPNLGRSYQNYPMLAAMQTFPNWALELPVFYHVKEWLLDCNLRTHLLNIFSSIY